MPVTCTAAGVVAGAEPFDILSDRQVQLGILYLMGVVAGQSSLTASQVLANAQKYDGLSDRQIQECILYLLCVANGGS